MKILLVNTVSLEENGISTFIINMAEKLVEKNINVTILAHNIVNYKLINRINRIGIYLKELPGRMANPFRYFIKLKKYLLSNNFDIIHVNGNSTTMAIELLAAKIAGIKVRIAHSHNTVTDHRVVNKILYPLFNYVVNGRLACNKAAGKWLFKNKSFDVINNGIDLKKYRCNTNLRKQIRDKYNISSTDYLIGHVGRFNRQKNQKFLVELMPLLNIKYKLILIGDGINYEDIKKLIKLKHLEKRIILTGAISNVNEYLSAMDIFVLPSFFEGEPFTLIEAMANGLKIFASDKIPKETNILNMITYLPLNMNVWKSHIVNYKKDCYRGDLSKENQVRLRLKGFDLNYNCKNLIKYYKEKLIVD